MTSTPPIKMFHLYRIYEESNPIKEIISSRPPSYKHKILYEYRKSYEGDGKKLSINHIESNEHKNELLTVKIVGGATDDKLLPPYILHIDYQNNPHKWTKSNTSHIKKVVKEHFNSVFIDDIYDFTDEKLTAYLLTLNPPSTYICSIQKMMKIKYEYQDSIIESKKLDFFKPTHDKLDYEALQNMDIVKKIKGMKPSNSTEKMIQAIYTESIPSRVGLYEELYVNDDSINNYLNVAEGVIIVRKFKTERSKGVQRFELTEPLKKAFKAYIHGQNRQGKKVNKVFNNYNNDVFKYIKLTSNMLRHIYCVQGLKVGITPDCLAFYMLTSPYMVQTHYIKEDYEGDGGSDE